ncbi:MAG: hypothetical protein CVT62_05065 [Actinobacteria bacterium HGW-Actinobacteria-2]|nr:MAG: hypothetical protein CVT62_05065 [Actinobacteria bacterium HGW-Actinobacteria-2]
MRLIDIARREAFLNRFTWYAQDYPGYVKVKRELRRELTLTADEVGMPAAIASLGHPAQLAAEYLSNLERPYPRWSTAVWWAGAGLYVLVGLGVAYSLGVMDSLAAVGGGSVDLVVFGTPVKFTNTAEEISTQFQLTPASFVWFMTATAAPYLIGARAWRLWPRSREAAISESHAT